MSLAVAAEEALLPGTMERILRLMAAEPQATYVLPGIRYTQKVDKHRAISNLYRLHVPLPQRMDPCSCPSNPALS